MKYVSRYVDGDVPRIFLAKLHKLWPKFLSCYWTSFTGQIFISDPSQCRLSSPKPNNKIKRRRKPKIRHYKHSTAQHLWNKKIPSLGLDPGSVCVSGTVAYCVSIPLSYCSCLTSDLKLWGLVLLNDMQILMSVPCTNQKRFGHSPFLCWDQ